MASEKQRRILLLRSGIGVFGAERVILELACGLRESGFEPIVGAIENKARNSTELAEAASSMGLQSEILTCRLPFDPGTVYRLREFIIQNEIDVVNPHGYKANFYAFFSTIGTDAIRLATCHPWTETDYSFMARLYTKLDMFLLRRMNKIVAVSDDVKKQLLASYPRADCSVIANGIDLSRFTGTADSRSDLRASLGMNLEHMVIGTIGRLVPEKGHCHLLKALESLAPRYPQIRLIFVGDGEQRSGLEQTVSQHGLADKVLFAGTRNDIPGLLEAFDIFVLPSISEGLPMAVLEAMAAGKPIVATRVGQIPQVIRHNYSGLLVEPANSEQLAGAIESLILDPKNAEALAVEARRVVEASFSNKAMTAEYIRHYEELVS